MKIKALVSFSGAFSMYRGEEKECTDEVILQDLLQAGHIEKVKPEKPKKDVKPVEGKRNRGK